MVNLEKIISVLNVAPEAVAAIEGGKVSRLNAAAGTSNSLTVGEKYVPSVLSAREWSINERSGQFLFFVTENGELSVNSLFSAYGHDALTLAPTEGVEEDTCETFEGASLEDIFKVAVLPSTRIPARWLESGCIMTNGKPVTHGLYLICKATKWVDRGQGFMQSVKIFTDSEGINTLKSLKK